MGGMSFGIKNISGKFKYVMSEQADKFKSGHTQNIEVPPLRRILAVSGHISDNHTNAQPEPHNQKTAQ